MLTLCDDQGTNRLNPIWMLSLQPMFPTKLFDSIPLSIIMKGVDDFRLFHELKYQLVSASNGYSGYNVLVHLRVGF